MSREMEYYEQFGSMSCADVGDKPTFAEADDESVMSDVGDRPSFLNVEEKPADPEEESTGAGS